MTRTNTNAGTSYDANGNTICKLDPLPDDINEREFLCAEYDPARATLPHITCDMERQRDEMYIALRARRAPFSVVTRVFSCTTLYHRPDHMWWRTRGKDHYDETPKEKQRNEVRAAKLRADTRDYHATMKS